MAFCQQCGTQNPDGSRFCTGCGADLTAQAAPQQAAPVNPNMGGQQAYSQQPNYGQTPQAFAQSGIGNYGTPAGLSKQEFLNLPENTKTKNSIKTAAIMSIVVAIFTVIVNFIQLAQIKAKIDSNPLWEMKEGFMTTFYTFIVFTICAAVCTLIAFLTLNMIIGIAGAVAYAISLIIALSSGGSVGWLCYVLMVSLIFVPYYLFTLNKQYEEYKGRSGMNF